MSLISTSCRCFNAVETALDAVKTGNACGASVTLQSVKQDGLLLQKQASFLSDQLKKAEEKHQQEDEELTRQVNKLHAEEVKLKNKKQALEAKKSALNEERERCNRNKQDASRRYQEAEEEKREAEKKCEELENLWWVPIVGAVLAVRELIENNAKKARDAYREMERYDDEMSRANSNIRWANSSISQVEKDQEKISRKVEGLKRQREACHKELSNIKTLVSFIMQATTFWEEVIMLTKAATVNTEQLQRIVDLAAKKNSLKILGSGGTQTKMSSFKEHWMEVAEMFASDQNNLILTETFFLTSH